MAFLLFGGGRQLRDVGGVSGGVVGFLIVGPVDVSHWPRRSA